MAIRVEPTKKKSSGSTFRGAFSRMWESQLLRLKPNAQPNSLFHLHCLFPWKAPNKEAQIAQKMFCQMVSQLIGHVDYAISTFRKTFTLCIV
jgi:hypothetical protein